MRVGARVGPLSASTSGSGCANLLIYMIVLGVIALFLGWPLMLGTWIATKFGAEEQSTAWNVAGWALEVPWLLLLLLAAIGYFGSSRSTRRTGRSRQSQRGGDRRPAPPASPERAVEASIGNAPIPEVSATSDGSAAARTASEAAARDAAARERAAELKGEEVARQEAERAAKAAVKDSLAKAKAQQRAAEDSRRSSDRASRRDERVSAEASRSRRLTHTAASVASGNVVVIDGSHTRVTLDDENLTIDGTNRLSRTALTGSSWKSLVLARAEITSVHLTPAGRATAGTFDIVMAGGERHAVRFLPKQEGGFRRLVRAINGPAIRVETAARSSHDQPPDVSPTVLAGRPPDWYPNPVGPGLRYWDGSQWTPHVSE